MRNLGKQLRARFVRDASVCSPLEEHRKEFAKKSPTVGQTKNCLAKRQAKCLVCYDLPMCDSWFGKGCPHMIEIPLLQLRRSAEMTDCQICHVLFGAIVPWVATTDENGLANAALIASECLRGMLCEGYIMVVPLEYGTESKTRILERNDEQEADFFRRRLYAAELFLDEQRFRTIRKSVSYTQSLWFLTKISDRKPIEKDPDSVASQSMIRVWLSDCLQNHDWCRQIAAHRPRSVPDRLVKIVSTTSIRLSTAHPKTTRYVALSYCWGAPNIFSTTQENLSNHVANIPWSSLPKTFRQALDMTRNLGYEYIWIDSLCIIQRNAEDFANQSSKMADIYANAVVVISADSGYSVEAGFLDERKYCSVEVEIPYRKRAHHENDRRNSNIQSVELDQPDHADQFIDDIDRVFVRPQIGKIPEIEQRNDHESFPLNPTFDRAWCFQEQRLATRIVHFTKNEMYWECGSQTTCECGRLSRNQNEDRPYLLTRYFNGLESSPFPNTRNEFWWSLVEEYSQRKVSVITDRLPAISGIASRMQSDGLGNYYTGMWERALPASLLWNFGGVHFGRPPMSEPYIGPTWSWVSVIGRICRPNFKNAGSFKVIATIKDIQCRLNSADIFGSVASASIVLTGPAKWDILESKAQEAPLAHTFYKAELRSEGEVLENLHLDITSKRIEDGLVTQYLGKVLCLIICGNDEKDHWHGLVLVKSTKQKGAFERIGTVQIYGKRGRGWSQTTVTII